jgi:hypothetical protein
VRESEQPIASICSSADCALDPSAAASRMISSLLHSDDIASDIGTPDHDRDLGDRSVGVSVKTNESRLSRGRSYWTRRRSFDPQAFAEALAAIPDAPVSENDEL